jgi:hypothetical protein
MTLPLLILALGALIPVPAQPAEADRLTIHLAPGGGFAARIRAR